MSGCSTDFLPDESFHCKPNHSGKKEERRHQDVEKCQGGECFGRTKHGIAYVCMSNKSLQEINSKTLRHESD